ncbi:chitin synthase-domain-containing protein [Gaertneriomyces semiglobifer]|nr:chitin synthase-domain-containing protein [Gaertneriomyces semiglobifer]
MTVSLPSRELASSTGSHSRRSPYGLELYSILLVTAYSEDSSGLRTTMSSLAATQYSDDHKLMVIIADGIITGSGNSKSTPELILEMLELDESWPAEPSPMLYQSISGSNEAKVYVAWYRNEGRCIPTLLIVKCGLDKERTALKPGNRGKRDSQLLLMAFLQRCLFNTPFSPLDYDLFQKSHYLMGVTPDKFEIILMVDADTKVAPDSLPRMVASMASDPTIMGLCGETRIANKNQSWVTRIQVFEYYLSHHLAKAFESVFGGVTCLPGCFCMYRIKAPKYIPSKKETQWVPILVHPEILQSYSTSHVSTLHKKNLLLLGEDRFLTTLMLSTFPQRKQIFVPRAYCKTVVPDTFKVLLSQRRRWINSTIHNLLELICVKELCGVLCLSMRFVVALELVGTVVLPAAIFFTFLLIIFSIIGPTEVIPLVLLGAILGLPAFLIVMTSRRYSYIYYMGVYLLALPVWNFVLPVYSFWHFDDFSWGQTRKVEGAGDERKGHADDQDDVVDEVPFRMWTAWEVERRRAIWGEWMKMKEQGLVKEGGTEGEKAEGDGDSAHGRSSLETVSDASTTV